jgi:hypothetical protein
MTYPISEVTRRVVYSGNGTTGPFSFSFEILTQGDIGVYVNSTLLTITTDYTVTINVDGTGSITLVTGGSLASAPTASDTISIYGNKGIARTTDFVTGGDLFASSLNDELDAQTIFAQQNSEAILRSLRAPVTDATTISMELPTAADRAGTVLGFNATTGNPEAGPEIADVSSLAAITADISTLADIEDGTDATDAIQTVAGISSNVSTVAGISSNVTTVAGISSDVTAVAADATDIGTVSTNIADVNTVAGISADVTTVAGIDSDVTAVAADATDIGTVSANIASVNAVAAIDSDVSTVAADSTDIGVVAGLSTEITALGPISADITAVAAIDSDVTTVAGIDSDVTTVAGVAANVTTVAGISSDVTTVAADGTDIGTVATNIANVNTVAGISGNVTTVAGISANVTSVAGNTTNINAVATDLTGVDDIGTVADAIADVSAVAAINSDVTTVAGIDSDVTAVAAIASDVSAVAAIDSNVTTVAGVSGDLNAVALTVAPVEALIPASFTIPTDWWDTGDRLLTGASERYVISNWQVSSIFDTEEGVWFDTYDSGELGGATAAGDTVPSFGDKSGNSNDATGSNVLLATVPRPALYNNQVSSEMIVDLPYMGMDSTVAYCTDQGVTILTGVTVGGKTNILHDHYLFGYVAIDRALTAQETLRLTQYLESRSFGYVAPAEYDGNVLLEDGFSFLTETSDNLELEGTVSWSLSA